jgi:hypothetical protein
MIAPRRLHLDQTGLIGKVVLAWVAVVVVLGLIAVDTASIVFSTFRLDDTAVTAATDAASVYEREGSVAKACDTAEQTALRLQPEARLAKKGCVIDRGTGAVTVRLRSRASTLLADRIPWTAPYTKILVAETLAPPSL